MHAPSATLLHLPSREVPAERRLSARVSRIVALAVERAVGLRTGVSRDIRCAVVWSDRLCPWPAGIEYCSASLSWREGHQGWQAAPWDKKIGRQTPRAWVQGQVPDNKVANWG